MLSAPAFDLFLALTALWSFASLWRAYALVAPYSQAGRHYVRDMLKGRRPSPHPRSQASPLLAWSLWVGVLFWASLWLLRSHSCLLWSHHLHVSNVSYTCMAALGLASLATLWALSYFSPLSRLPVGPDYALSLAQLCLYMPALALSNTALTLLFFLEVASTLIMYNFVSTRPMLSQPTSGSQALPHDAVSRHFFNMVFFHFWASFFGTSLLLYGVIGLYSLCGTTEWSYLAYFASSLGGGGQPSLPTLLTSSALAIGFWIKLGVAPFFAYKVEVYKGLPIFTVLFYSLVYFAIFFGAFYMLVAYYFSTLMSSVAPLTYVAAACTLLVALCLFDSQSTRNFFALSSVLTSTNLFLAVLA